MGSMEEAIAVIKNNEQLDFFRSSGHENLQKMFQGEASGYGDVFNEQNWKKDSGLFGDGQNCFQMQG